MSPKIVPNQKTVSSSEVDSNLDIHHTPDALFKNAWEKLMNPYTIFMMALSTFMKAVSDFTNAVAAYNEAVAAYGEASRVYSISIAQAYSTFVTSVAVATMSGDYDAIAKAEAELIKSITSIKATYDEAVIKFDEAKKAYNAAIEAYQTAWNVYQDALEAYQNSLGETDSGTVLVEEYEPPT